MPLLLTLLLLRRFFSLSLRRVHLPRRRSSLPLLLSSPPYRLLFFLLRLTWSLSLNCVPLPSVAAGILHGFGGSSRPARLRIAIWRRLTFTSSAYFSISSFLPSLIPSAVSRAAAATGSHQAYRASSFLPLLPFLLRFLLLLRRCWRIQFAQAFLHQAVFEGRTSSSGCPAETPKVLRICSAAVHPMRRQLFVLEVGGGTKRGHVVALLLLLLF